MLKFSAFDVLDGTELDSVDTISFDGIVYDLTDVHPVFDENTGRYVYTLIAEVLKNTLLRVTKNTYFPFIGRYDLSEVTSIADLYYTLPEHAIDLGRVGLLNEVKEDAIILIWNKYPSDLDSRLTCPNGETVGMLEAKEANEEEHFHTTLKSNYYAKMSVDSIIGFGPETVVVNHWSNLNDKYKIGGKWKFFVKWYKDGNNL